MILAFLLLVTSSVATAPEQPLPSGRYTFQHRFAEQPGIESIQLTAIITGKHIELVNSSSASVFPLGVIESGTLMWHIGSKQWIVGHRRSDRVLKDVGGCSDGPSVIDLELGSTGHAKGRRDLRNPDPAGT